MLRRIALSAIAVLTMTAAAKAERTLLFTGGSFTENSFYAHVGGVHAFSGDLKKDGFLLRATGAFGGYDYDRPGTTSVDGDVYAFDLMGGYQFFAQNNRFSFYVGGDYQNHDLSPNDVGNPVRGDEFGVKAQAEASLHFTPQLSLDVIGSYSSAFDTYWSKLQPGYHFGKVVAGPKASFMGSESYDQQRYGVFVKDIMLGNALSLGASAGYAETEGRGEDGAYGEVALSWSY
jgi:hypothetical protein